MDQAPNKELILNIFKNSIGENLEDISGIIYNIRKYEEYEKRKKTAIEMDDNSDNWYLENYKEYDLSRKYRVIVKRHRIYY